MPVLPSAPAAGATSAVLNITAATALRTSPCYVVTLSVLVAGAAGNLYDAASAGGTAGRAIFPTPATVGIYNVGWPCASGLVASPGAGQTIAISLG